MRNQINYQMLYEIEKDIDHLMETSPAFRLFNQEKVRRFATQNKQRIEVMHSNMDRIRNTYVKKDDNGKLMTKDSEEGTKLWMFETEDKEKEYLKEWNEFMQISFDVTV